MAMPCQLGWGALKRGAAVIGLLWILGACSFAPVGELRVYRESVLAANGTATTVLDELSGAERRIKRNLVAVQSGRPQFSAAEAGYFADIGDAPGTEPLRRAHNTLDRLSDVLLSLAEGRTASDDAGSLAALAGEIGGLLAAISGSTIPVGPAFAVVRPSLELVSREAQRREARRVIAEVEQQQLVQKLTAALIDATPAIFTVLIREADRRASTPGAGPDAMEAYQARINRMRVVLSNYVILLRRQRAAWEQAVLALHTGTSPSTIVLAERIGELRAASEATRRAMAELHGGR
jgi:hypothetical protein